MKQDLEGNMSDHGQLDLDYYPPTGGRDPSTSFEAADRIRSVAPSLRQRVLDCIVAQGAHGATCDEICVSLEMQVQTATPRLNELMRAGYIRRSQEKRPTRSGRNAFVWLGANT